MDPFSVWKKFLRRGQIWMPSRERFGFPEGNLFEKPGEVIGVTSLLPPHVT
jgi:hypothetical protein